MVARIPIIPRLRGCEQLGGALVGRAAGYVVRRESEELINSRTVIRLLKNSDIIGAYGLLPIVPRTGGEITDSWITSESREPIYIEVKGTSPLFWRCATVETAYDEWLSYGITHAVRLVAKEVGVANRLPY